MEIIKHAVEKVEDVTGILEGDRYEFLLNVEVDEEDELYTENGIYVKVIFAVKNDETRIVQYHIYEKTTDKYLDFELEEDELVIIHDYCKQISIN